MKDRNKNKPGYKKTKAGWIPQEWRCAPAGSLFDIQLGKMLSKQARNGYNPQPYLANYNVRWGGFDLAEVQQMDFYEKEVAKFQLQQGDLLVCEGGEVGRCAVWEEQIKPCYFQKALHRVRPSDADIDVYYIMYFLHYAVTSPIMVSYVGQSSISHFTREKFVKFPIALPPIGEQRKICQILSAWDTAIAKLQDLIEVKKRRKGAIIKHLFSRQWLMNRDGKNLEKHHFGEFVKLRKEQWRDRNTDRNLLCVELEDIEPGTGRIRSVAKEGICSSAKNCFYAGDILFGKLRPYLRKYLKAGLDGVCSSEIWVLNPDPDKVDGDYLYYLIQTDDFLKTVSVSSGSKMPRAEWRFVADRKYFIPGLSTQKYVGELLSVADTEIDYIESERAFLDTQKRGLMQKLLTGEVRVKI